MNSKEALKKYFGYDEFRPAQEEIIEAISARKNVLAVLPTGGGKSLCYQIPALTAPGFSIVISPLIALMKDQVDALNKNERIAAFVNSTLSYSETEEVFRETAAGKIKLLYLAPERLESSAFAERIKNLGPEFIFIDEAHCISEWGHNFRPSYRNIREFTEFTGVKSIAAFTATATPEVVKDIIVQLGMDDTVKFIRGFERDNLTLRIIKSKKKKIECHDLIVRYKTPAIIYTTSRKRTEEVAEFLKLYGLNAESYHAGMAPEERKHIQEYFLDDKIDIIVATNAFGMGIDKKDIRLIIHFNMPGSIENYYQEIGRAGRDGNEAYAFLLYDDSDKHIHNFFIENSYPDKELIVKIYNAICDYGRVAIGNFYNSEIALNREFISKYVKEDVSQAKLSAAVSLLEQAGYLKNISEFGKKYFMQFNLDEIKLREYTKAVSNNTFKDVIVMLLREYGSKLINSKSEISPAALASSYGVSTVYIEDTLQALSSSGIIDYVKPAAEKGVMLTSSRVDDRYLILDYKKINENYANAVSKLDSMVDFVFSTECRLKFIIGYFGEKKHDYKCGKCDNCIEGSGLSGAISSYLGELMLRTVHESPDGISEIRLIEILRGKTKDVVKPDISTFGTCSNYSSVELREVLESLIARELLVRRTEKRSKLYVTQAGLEMLKQETAEVRPAAKNEFGTEDDLELYNKLREVRTQAANRFQQTSYLICPDELLRKVAENKPISEERLLAIKGFNHRMFNKLGADFLEVIKEFLKQKQKTGEEKPAKPVPGNIAETYKLLKEGYPLKDIASLRKLSEAVISMQIESILEYYPEQDISHLFNSGELELIMQEIKEGYMDLKDLKSRLPASIDYAQIRIAAAKAKGKHRE